MIKHIYEIDNMKNLYPNEFYIHYLPITHQYQLEYLSYTNNIRNLTILENKQELLKKEIRKRISGIFFNFIKDFENNKYTKSTLYMLQIILYNKIELRLNINQLNKEPKIHTYKYYYDYMKYDKNRYHRLNNKQFSKEEKNIYELWNILTKNILTKDSYNIFNCRIDTHWDNISIDFKQ